MFTLRGGVGFQDQGRRDPAGNAGGKQHGDDQQNRCQASRQCERVNVVVIYSGADRDSYSRCNQDVWSSERDRRGVRRERSEREVGHPPQCCWTEGLFL